MDNVELKEKLEKLAKLEAKEKKASEYNKNYYRNWKVGFDKKVDFYNKWYGKKIGGVELK
jgi:hypothetical protein